MLRPSRGSMESKRQLILATWTPTRSSSLASAIRSAGVEVEAVPVPGAPLPSLEHPDAAYQVLIVGTPTPPMLLTAPRV